MTDLYRFVCLECGSKAGSHYDSSNFRFSVFCDGCENHFHTDIRDPLEVDVSDVIKGSGFERRLNLED